MWRKAVIGKLFLFYDESIAFATNIDETGGAIGGTLGGAINGTEDVLSGKEQILALSIVN